MGPLLGQSRTSPFLLSLAALCFGTFFRDPFWHSIVALYSGTQFWHSFPALYYSILLGPSVTALFSSNLFQHCILTLFCDSVWHFIPALYFGTLFRAIMVKGGVPKIMQYFLHKNGTTLSTYQQRKQWLGLQAHTSAICAKVHVRVLTLYFFWP